MMALVTELQARASDLETQRDAAQVHADQRQEALTVYLDQWQRREDDLAEERRRQTEYERALEERAYGEVDRARQELSILGKRMDAAARARAASEFALKTTVDRLTLALTSAQRELADARKKAPARTSSKVTSKARKLASPPAGGRKPGKRTGRAASKP